MFRGIRSRLGDLVESVRDRLAEVLSGGKTHETTEAAPRAEEKPDETPTEPDIPDDDIEDADQFEDYLDSLDDSVYYDEIYQEVRVFEETLIEPEYLRVIRYTSGSEAQDFLDEAGLSAFAEVLYIESEDLFTIAVYDSPGAIA